MSCACASSTLMIIGVARVCESYREPSWNGPTRKKKSYEESVHTSIVTAGHNSVLLPLPSGHSPSPLPFFPHPLFFFFFRPLFAGGWSQSELRALQQPELEYRESRHVARNCGSHTLRRRPLHPTVYVNIITVKLCGLLDAVSRSAQRAIVAKAATLACRYKRCPPRELDGMVAQ
eukprot:scaffold19910_cov145-Isochrysis_galbana.AAC.4